MSWHVTPPAPKSLRQERQLLRGEGQGMESQGETPCKNIQLDCASVPWFLGPFLWSECLLFPDRWLSHHSPHHWNSSHAHREVPRGSLLELYLRAPTPACSMETQHLIEARRHLALVGTHRLRTVSFLTSIQEKFWKLHKYVDIWNLLLNNQYIKEEIKKEIKKILEQKWKWKPIKTYSNQCLCETHTERKISHKELITASQRTRKTRSIQPKNW